MVSPRPRLVPTTPARMAVPISGRVILTLFSLPNCGLRDRLARNGPGGPVRSSRHGGVRRSLRGAYHFALSEPGILQVKGPWAPAAAGGGTGKGGIGNKRTRGV